MHFLFSLTRLRYQKGYYLFGPHMVFMESTEVSKTGLTETELREETLTVLNPYTRSDLKRVTVPHSLLVSSRLESIDFIRGLALVLMMLSHGIKGLLLWENFPTWGLVPVHVITKFSSTLFIMTFGISLAVAYLPHVGTPLWPQKRMRLLWRSLEIMFWYKVLTVAQMIQGYSNQEILDALLFKTFPDFVEVLGFYAFALLWIPLLLPLWKRTPILLKVGYVAAMIYGHFYFSYNFSWENISLKAIMVENRGYFTFGQLTRGPLVLFGLILGEQVYQARRDKWLMFIISLILISLGAALLGMHFGMHKEMYFETLLGLAKNAGKHPPSQSFMLFSLGGALMLCGMGLAGGRILSRIFYPITLIGRYSLEVFVFHIMVIFIVYRYLLDYYHNVDYLMALNLTAILILGSAAWAGLIKWRRSQKF